MHLVRNFLIFLVVTYSAAQQAPPLPDLTGRITANALKADVSFLASDALEGRGTPSRGLDIAAEYIAAQFRRAGLEPAGDDGYFQTAPFASVTPNTEGLELAIKIGGQSLKADKASIGLQEAAPADLKDAPAVTVTMNSPTALDALTVQEVKGKALLLVIPPGTPYTIRRGIRGAIDRLDPAVVISVRANGMGLNTNTRLRDVSSRAFRVPIVGVWDAAIRKAVESGGRASVTVHVRAPAVTPVKLRNVVGVLRGSDAVLKETGVVVSAHYDHLGIRGTGEGDHIFNGANDDASGTASVIEIANALAALPLHPRRSIVFVTFFGEELGELGSQFYVKHSVFPLSKTVADINLEQLGRTDDSQGPHVGMFNLTGFDFTDMATVFRKAGAEAGVQVVKDEQNGDPYFTASDNYAFANAGVPSTTASVAYQFPDYHRAGDEWPKLDYENMAKVDRALALAIEAIADSDTEPHWNAANPQVRRFAVARKAQ
jgi:hypothetical protein